VTAGTEKLQQAFKVPQLRSFYQKRGFQDQPGSTSVNGFGFCALLGRPFPLALEIGEGADPVRSPARSFRSPVATSPRDRHARDRIEAGSWGVAGAIIVPG
jgi:hypothetical protein